MTRTHRYGLTTALVAALVAPPVASAVLIPIEPDKKPGKRAVVRKAQPNRAHVVPIRKKPPLQP